MDAFSSWIANFLKAWGSAPEPARSRTDFGDPVPPAEGAGPLPVPEPAHWAAHLAEVRRFLQVLPEWARAYEPEETADLQGFAFEAHHCFATKRRSSHGWRAAYTWVVSEELPAKQALYRWQRPPSAIAQFHAELPDQPLLARVHSQLRRNVTVTFRDNRGGRLVPIEREVGEPAWHLAGRPLCLNSRPGRVITRDWVRLDLSHGTVPQRIERLLGYLPFPPTATEIFWILFESLRAAGAEASLRFLSA